MLMVILLCFSLKVADVSLSESGHLVPWWLTSHKQFIKLIETSVNNIFKDGSKPFEMERAMITGFVIQ
jgi:hypothetical protein